MLALVRAAGLTDRTTVMAFDWTILERVARSSPVRLTGLLARHGADRLGGVGPRLTAAGPRRERSRVRAHPAHAGCCPRGAGHGTLDRGLDRERAGGAPPRARGGRGLRDDRPAGSRAPAAWFADLMTPVLSGGAVKVVLAIDQGTTGSTALVVGATGPFSGAATGSCPSTTPSPAG